MHSARSAQDDVEQAAIDLEAEHRVLDETLDSVAAATEAPALAQALARLQRLLKAHFEHEEYPGGLYDMLGACSAPFRDRVSTLTDAHYRLLSTARSLDHLASDGSATSAELRERARKLVDLLREHEAEEHSLAEAARAGAVRPPP